MQLNGTPLSFNSLSHLKLHDQFLALTDMKLHAKNQLYTSISFWDIKVLKVSLGMPDSTHLNLHNLFITKNTKLHPQNQLYTSFSFWDLSFNSLFGHAWSHPPKITSLIFSFNRYVHACKKSTLCRQKFFRYYPFNTWW